MKPKLGEIVLIELYDHADMDNNAAQGGLEAVIVFETMGRLVAETPVDYRICFWGVPQHAFDPNNEYISVLKSAVKKIRRLK